MENKIFTGKEIILYARSISPSLANKERRVAQFIANNYETLADSTISDIAVHLKISEATITKVCKKLQCDGYLQLKRLIKAYIDSTHNVETYEEGSEFKKGDSNDLIAEKVLLNAILALQETLDIFNYDAFNKACEIFKEKAENNKIILVGSGGSSVICEDFQHKLLKIGIVSHVYKDSHMQLMFTSLINKGDIVLGVSHSGTTQHIVHVIQAARDRGAHTISVTNYMNSKITKAAEINLVSTAQNAPITGENAAARVVQLTILDALYTNLAIKGSESYSESLTKTSDVVKDYRY
ncbi:hypothetical protein AST03_06885 [Staphylococcus equorum]|uniref:MurR/RpiR family transcriptional regulator n=1 Tax=Staphylococcus equorum TaxID=246432 RepID=UPI000853C754|nr:SIS domain-containing protein [Staphylococcus equorum]OEK79683.1 hypothetical protein AST03_06885 [Staphylococcus equorum]